mgnify:CR=1 FL=1
MFITEILIKAKIGIFDPLGGNSREYARVITTAIALEVGRGEIELAIALGMILLFLALLVNIIMNRIQHR